MAEVRLALVGCGGITRNHITGYRELMANGARDFRVTACCDIETAKAEQAAADIAAFQGRSPKVFESVERVIDASIADAADVCVPHYAHHSVAIPLLEAGMHVMVEKPIGITVKATRKIIEAACRNGRVLATAENIRRYLTARSCEWAINSEKLIGDVRAVVVQSANVGPLDYDNPAFKWRGIKTLTGGGMIMDSGAHFTDMMLCLFGDVDEVFCAMNTYDRRIIHGAPVVGDAPADVEDTWQAMIRFKSGLVTTWIYSRSLPGTPLKNALYFGSKGTMRDLGFPFHCFQSGGEATLADGTVVSSDEIQERYRSTLTDEEQARLFPYGCTNGFAVEVGDFIAAIVENRGPDLDGTGGLRAKALCEACYESATLGAPVRFDDVLSGEVCAYQDPIDEFWGL